MTHPITLGGLLLSLLLLGGIGLAGIGLLMTFASGMSDAPVVGDSVGRQGCTTSLIGLALIGGALWAMLS